jgi:TatD family-associated radical SAM protein
MDHMGESHSLWLEREPSAEEVIAEFAKFDMTQYEEVVFCGFGEPTEALDVLLVVAEYVKKTFGKPVRINTNGLGNLIHGEDITPKFQGLVDTVSISLNTPNAQRYHDLVRSKFGDQSFDAMLDFAKKCTAHVSKVVMTTVDTTISKEEEEQCRKICEEIGAVYRIRPWED